ncbi:hypothetical protein M2405_006165 [Rhodococcus erythropolis]|nr:hypothetical protein [Rhodococcus erythropolis]MCW2425142.1 hypothetical protein [Rhodococcus erythropolis]
MACAHGQATALARPDMERFAADAAHYGAQPLNTETLG